MPCGAQQKLEIGKRATAAAQVGDDGWFGAARAVAVLLKRSKETGDTFWTKSPQAVGVGSVEGREEGLSGVGDGEMLKEHQV